MYKAMYAVGFALMMLLNLFRYKDYRISQGRAVVYTLVTYVYGVLSAMAMGRIYTAVSAAAGVDETGGVAIFGAVIFTPVLLLITVLAEKLVAEKASKKTYKNKHGKDRPYEKKIVSTRNTLDFLTPGIFLILTCAKLGCFFEGCCYGVECGWGVYSKHADAVVFPVQIFEVATMCAVLLLCYFLKRTRFFRRGMAYPLTAALYCVGRFGWEYKRYYAEEMRHIAFGFTIWQFFCIIVFAASLISIAILYKTQPSDPLQKKLRRK